ncbi:MAG: hypothetical protein ACYCT0_12285 [Sulfobacillus sp.]
MRWSQASAGMGFSREGSIKGWRLSDSAMVIWYRMSNAQIAMGELLNLLEWAFGPVSTIDTECTKCGWVWESQWATAKLSVEEHRAQALVMAKQRSLEGALGFDPILVDAIH